MAFSSCNDKNKTRICNVITFARWLIMANIFVHTGLGLCLHSVCQRQSQYFMSSFHIKPSGQSMIVATPLTQNMYFVQSSKSGYTPSAPHTSTFRSAKWINWWKPARFLVSFPYEEVTGSFLITYTKQVYSFVMQNLSFNYAKRKFTGSCCEKELQEITYLFQP